MNTSPLNLIFMGTPTFALPTLRALVEVGHRVVAVYTQPPRRAHRGQKETPSPIHAYALSRNLTVHTPATLKDEAEQQRFRAYRADAAIVAAYGLLLPKPILEGTRMGCINIHPSLLPRWRGAAPIQRTIMAGDGQTGVVIMQMNEGLDTGDMLLMRRFGISDGTNAGTLHDALAAIAAPLALETLQGLTEGTILPKKQPDEGVTYAKKITKEECRIDWAQPAYIIRQKILGLSPQPGAIFMHEGEPLKLLDAQIGSQGDTGKPPGTVLDDRLTIQCGEGCLAALTVQRPGKKPMPATDMLKGHPIPPGTGLR